MKNPYAELQQSLSNSGFKSSIVGIEHLADLKCELQDLLERGTLNREFYREITSRLNLNWHFEPPANLSEAKSVIVVAASQQKVKVKFEISHNEFEVIIPPTYVHDLHTKISDLLAHNLKKHNYKLCNAILPEKLLATRSGLARYGRNNIVYADGWGSYFMIKAFFTDMPCPVDNWQKAKMMDQCERCSLCREHCPTNAIQADRFLIQAEKCLTFFNEKSGDFPEWIQPHWHNCLIGCMICQDICPVNKRQIHWVTEEGTFSEEETLMVIQGTPINRLPRRMKDKLKKLCMLDDYHLLSRNLSVLLH